MEFPTFKIQIIKIEVFVFISRYVKYNMYILIFL